MNSYLVIVSKNDRPLYEAEFFRNDFGSKSEDDRALNQFIVHAALDMVDECTGISAPYLKVVDRYERWLISAFVTAGGDRFMLLHDVKNEDNIKTFFYELHELYTKYILNPFYEGAIDSSAFEVKLRLLAKKYIEK